jgi:hypothetical protein
MAVIVGLSVGGAAIAESPGPNVDPRADGVLRQMSRYLRSKPAIRVDSRAVDELVTDSGQKIQVVSRSQVAMRRPNRLRSDRLGPLADAEFRYDGHSFSLYGKRTGYYAIAPAPSRIDDAIDEARDRLGLDAPGADLLMSNPYAVLMQDVTDGKYLGVEPCGGDAVCHHLAFSKPYVDWQLWVETGDRPVPRRFVVVSKTVKGQPEFSTDLTDWETDAVLPDDLFHFTPPPGAQRIRFLQADSGQRQGG